jgi:hypothetical protein
MHWKSRSIVSLLAGLLLAGLVTVLFPAGKWWISLLSFTVLSGLALYGLLSIINYLGSRRRIAWMTMTAFFLRLLVGVGLMLALPVWGYDNEQQQAGYTFRDAYERDTASWQTAVSGESLLTVFSEDFYTDQYGGLAFLSVLIYRFLSPDVHRPYLMLILTSFVFGAGVPFFYKAVSKRWRRKTALAASWIVVLYPEGIFFTASQMREPLILGAGMILFWAVIMSFAKKRPKGLIAWAVGSILLMLFISPLLAAAVLVLCGVLFALAWIQQRTTKKWQGWLTSGLFVMILLLAGTGAFLGRGWLSNVIWWDMNTMIASSGHVQQLVRDLPQPAQYAFLTTYGILQMVPPATVIQDATPLWKVISVFRSVGWYCLLPLLIFGWYAVWKKENMKDRRLLFWMLVFVWFWMLFSSLRAGGDAWDNPRYRLIMLPWMALLAVTFYRSRDLWLRRLVAVMLFAIAVFTYWYIARYLLWFAVPSLPLLVGMIIVAGLLVFGWGIWQEHKKKIGTASQ